MALVAEGYLHSSISAKLRALVRQAQEPLRLALDLLSAKLKRSPSVLSEVLRLALELLSAKLGVGIEKKFSG